MFERETEIEKVGIAFATDSLISARDKALSAIEEVAPKIHVGMSEKEAKALLGSILNEMGAEKIWHPPQIRFGENTVLAFGERGRENARLSENEIFFFDVGPIFNGHEGDVGRTFVIGDDAEMIRCREDVGTIWHSVREHWAATKCSGREMYRFADACARERGWQLLLKKACGHRIGDFPHPRGDGALNMLDTCPRADRWILEIQIRHPRRIFGAFFEDLLRPKPLLS